MAKKKYDAKEFKRIMTDFSTPESSALANRWLLRGLVTIFQYQTEAEKVASITNEDNGVGFNGSDAFILSEFAKKQMAYPNYRFSDKQMGIIAKAMPKYAGQLARIANAKADQSRQG